MIRDTYNPQTIKSGLQKYFFVYISDFNDLFIKLCTLIPFVTIILFFFAITCMADENSVHLTCQMLEYHIPTKKVFVQGEITMTEESFQLTSENMELDLASGKGMAKADVQIYLTQGYRMDSEAKFYFLFKMFKYSIPPYKSGNSVHTFLRVKHLPINLGTVALQRQ